MKRSYYPPSEVESESFHLERCLRILPHDQDTSGFFIALLSKNASLPGHQTQSSPSSTTNLTQQPKQQQQQHEVNNDELAPGDRAQDEKDRNKELNEEMDTALEQRQETESGEGDGEGEEEDEGGAMSVNSQEKGET